MHYNDYSVLFLPSSATAGSKNSETHERLETRTGAGDNTDTRWALAESSHCSGPFCRLLDLGEYLNRLVVEHAQDLNVLSSYLQAAQRLEREEDDHDDDDDDDDNGGSGSGDTEYVELDHRLDYVRQKFPKGCVKAREPKDQRRRRRNRVPTML